MTTIFEGKAPCGWCITGHHAQCLGHVKSYDTIWLCGCKENKDGCGRSSTRNAQLPIAGASVSVEAPSPADEVQPAKADSGDTSSPGSDSGTGAVKPATTGSRRGRKPKAVAEPTPEAEGAEVVLLDD